MRKSSIIIFILLFMSVNLFAQDNSITGQWLLNKVEVKGEIQELYYIQSFKENGNVEIMGMDVGTWEYNKETKEIVMESTMDKDFNGISTVLKLNSKELIVQKNDAKVYYSKINNDEIIKSNKKSNLAGIWKSKNEFDETQYLKFELPDKFSFFGNFDGGTSKSSGTWIFQPEENSFIVIARSRFCDGKNKLLKLNEEELEFENNGKMLKAEKLKQNAKDREELNFTEQDIYESYEKQSTQPSQFSLPWQNSDVRTSYLKNVIKLKYNHSELLADLNAFDTKEVSANVIFEQDYNQVIIENIFGEISDDESNENHFYPIQQPYDFRLVTEKEITVPAGTFNCLVIESVSSSDLKIRYYMIINRPGIYAKVIVTEKQFDEEKYDEYELTEIEDNYQQQINEDIIGNWLLVKTKTDKKSKIMSTDYDFINDGRLSINNAAQGSFFSWNCNKGKNTIQLTMDENVNDLKIVKLNNNLMELKNDEITYSFVKFSNQPQDANNKKSGLTGYWLLTNTSERYTIMKLGENNLVSGIDHFNNPTLEENYFSDKGKWQYNPVDSTLLLKVGDYQESQNRGSYKVWQSKDSELTLSNGIDRLVYLRLDPEEITKNNKESKLEGLWELKRSDGKTIGFEFRAPYQFMYSHNNNKENLHSAGIWFYDPELKKVFVGAMIHGVEGFNKINKIEKDTIEFENGLIATKVK